MQLKSLYMDSISVFECHTAKFYPISDFQSSNYQHLAFLLWTQNLLNCPQLWLKLNFRLIFQNQFSSHLSIASMKKTYVLHQNLILYHSQLAQVSEVHFQFFRWLKKVIGWLFYIYYIYIYILLLLLYKVPMKIPTNHFFFVNAKIYP